MNESDWRRNYEHKLYHYGIKGMKKGVRRGPPYPIGSQKSGVDKRKKSDILKQTITGHKDAPRKAAPNSVIDHVDESGKVTSRSFYGEDGLKKMDIHTTDHGNPKWHNRGKHGEHAHEYLWDENGRLKGKTERDLTVEERKENEDIL